MKPRERGHAAEKAAVALLRSKGYKIIQTNYRCSLGEIDIIVMDAKELVFVEVRSRKNGRYGDALDAIGYTKQRQVIRVARAYINDKEPRFDTSRFDVIVETGRNMNHLIDAFR